MSIRVRLSEIESAEDLFTVLNVPYDRHVLAVHRMRILRRFGRALLALAETNPNPSDEEAQAYYAAELQTIHEQCARGMREAQPVFQAPPQSLIQLRRGPKPSQYAAKTS